MNVLVISNNCCGCVQFLGAALTKQYYGKTCIFVVCNFYAKLSFFECDAAVDRATMMRPWRAWREPWRTGRANIKYTSLFSIGEFHLCDQAYI